jgi:hypothetical protein
MRIVPPAGGCPSAGRRRGLTLWVAALSLLGASGPAAAGSGAPEALLGGLLPTDQTLTEAWCWSGAWLYPVGDPLDLTAAPPDSEPPYRVRRGLRRQAKGVAPHDGVDLSNQQGGGRVRAAALGIVVAAGLTDSGYGYHVVLAHRLPSGRTAYSVYAHLEPGSIAVGEGELVPAGCLLGRVGRSGRASNEHLHFEVRIARRPFSRWEKARPVAPLRFVKARLPGSRPDTAWAAPCLEWAECSALIAGGQRGDEPLDHVTWWRMLAQAGRVPLAMIPAQRDSLRQSLVEVGLLAKAPHPVPPSPVEWSELGRDLARLAEVGLRVPPCPLDARQLEDLCAVRLSVQRPGRTPTRLGRQHRSPLTLADACLALADASLAETDR